MKRSEALEWMMRIAVGTIQANCRLATLKTEALSILLSDTSTKALKRSIVIDCFLLPPAFGRAIRDGFGLLGARQASELLQAPARASILVALTVRSPCERNLLVGKGRPMFRLPVYDPVGIAVLGFGILAVAALAFAF